MPARPKAVLDTTVLISAFLTPQGVAAELLVAGILVVSPRQFLDSLRAA